MVRRKSPDTVLARRVEQRDDLLTSTHDLNDGAFFVDETGHRFHCICPCGCGAYMSLPINDTPGTHPSWSWNGDLEAPTLTPSIRDLGGCFFHGFLTGGIWTFCGDSGVKG